MIKIVENVKYIIEIKNFSFGPLSREDLIENFKDGRAFGLIGEYILPAISSGKISKAANGNSYDVQKKGVKIEQRTLTKRGLKLTPSNQTGSGRSFKLKEFKEKLDGIDWFFIVDNTNFPYLEAVFVKASKIGLEQHSFRYSSAREEFFNCAKQVSLDI
jgi:hypothetical protein